MEMERTGSRVGELDRDTGRDVVRAVEVVLGSGLGLPPAPPWPRLGLSLSSGWYPMVVRRGQVRVAGRVRGGITVLVVNVVKPVFWK